MVVVPADSVDVEPTPTDSRLDGAFRSLENQAAYALSQADLAAQHAPDRHPNTNTAPRRRGLALPGRWGALATVAPYPIRGCPQLVGPARPLCGGPAPVLSVAVSSDGVGHFGQAPIAALGQRPQFVERCRVRAVVLGPRDQLPPIDREQQPIEHITQAVGGISHRQSRAGDGNHPRVVSCWFSLIGALLDRIGRPADSSGNCTACRLIRAGGGRGR